MHHRARLFVPDAIPLELSEQAIDAIASRLRQGSNGHDKPTVPMPGGWGSLFLDQRHLLSTAYLYGVGPALRAYVSLGFVGWRSEEGGRADNLYGRIFLRHAAGWFDSFPVELDGQDLASRILPGMRWPLLLAALRMMARTAAGEDLGSTAMFYEAAVERCCNSTITVGGNPAPGGGHAAGAVHAPDPRWIPIAQLLFDDAKRNRLLARLAMHVLHARLSTFAPSGDGTTRPFYRQLRAWFGVVVRPDSPACPNICSIADHGHRQAVTELWTVLSGLRLLGGHASLDLGEDLDLPAVLRPYAGRELPPLDRVMVHVPLAAQPTFTSAFLLGELLANRLIDLLQVCSDPPAGGGFSEPGYEYLGRRMDTTRHRYNAAHPAPLAATEERLAVRAFFAEMARADGRTPRRVKELLSDIPATAAAGLPACAACKRLAA